MISQKLHALKMALSATIIVMLLMGTTQIVMEPTLSEAAFQATTTVSLTVTGGISLTIGGNVTMSPAITLSNATSTGSTIMTVITNDADGYTLSVNASTSAALHTGTDSIADYTESGAGVPEAWSVSSSAEFGYSVFGDDVESADYGTDGTCESGTLTSAERKYEGFSTTNNEISQSNTATAGAGVVATLCLAVEQQDFNIPDGAYTADIEITAVVK